MTGPASLPLVELEVTRPPPTAGAPGCLSPRKRKASRPLSFSLHDGPVADDASCPPTPAPSPSLLSSPPGEDIRLIPIGKGPARRRRTQTELLLADMCNDALPTPSRLPDGYNLHLQRNQRPPLIEEEAEDNRDDDEDMEEGGQPERMDIMDLSDDTPEPLDADLEAEINPIGISFSAYLHSLVAA